MFGFAGRCGRFSGRLRRILISLVVAVLMGPLAAAARADYPSTVLGDHPISYWRLNDGAGSTAHDTRGNDDGSFIGGSWSSDAPVSGGGSVDLSSDGDQVLVSNASEAGLQPAHWSLDLWEKIAAPPSGSANLFRARAFGWELAMGTDGKLDVGVDTSSSASVSASGGASVADGSWHYVAVTFDYGALTLCVDGNAVATTSTGSATTYYCCDDQDVIGADTPGNYTASGINTFPGQLSEVALYNYGLTASQVAAHYAAAGRPGPCSSSRVISPTDALGSFQFDLVEDPLGPLPINVTASTSVGTLDACSQNVDILRTSRGTADVGLEVQQSNPQSSAADFFFEIEAKAPQWSPAVRQDEATFDIGKLTTAQVDFSKIIADINQHGEVELPIARLTANPQNALLINDGSSHYLSVQTKQEGELAAAFKPRDYFDFLRLSVQLNPEHVLEIAAATLANEAAAGLNLLPSRFPGIVAIPAGLVASYAQNLFASQISAVAGSPGGNDRADGRPIGIVILGGIGFILFHAAGAAGGFVVGGPPGAFAGAVAASAPQARPALVAPAVASSVTRLNARSADLHHVHHLYVAAVPVKLVRTEISQTFQTPVGSRIGPIVTSTRKLRARRHIVVAVGQLANRKASQDPPRDRGTRFPGSAHPHRE
jgi:Concanavalin A-like lectin/glucanases superfamily